MTTHPLFRLESRSSALLAQLCRRLRIDVALCVLAFAGGCASAPSAPPAATTPAPLAPASERAIKRAGERADTTVLERHLEQTSRIIGSPVTIGNRLRLLIDGPATHEAMFAAMRAARHSIELESYIIEDDQAGQELADLLIGQRARGVTVSIIYDSLGSIGTSREYFERLRAAGIAVCEYNPISPARARLSWRLNQRDHRKILVVDGATAFTGGINISSVYSTSSFSRRASAPDPKQGWRDTHIEVRGPAVREFQQLFDEAWSSQRCETRPPRRDASPAAFADGKPVRIIGSGPSSRPSVMYIAFLSAISLAERSVHLTQAYFVPDRRTLDALIGAARRGVDVTLVLPSISDFWAPLAAGRSHYEELLAAGVRIYERQGALLHAKTAVIDGVWSTVGSSNLDWRSFVHNEEANVVVFDDAFGREMEQVFQRDVERSVPIDAQRWSQRDAAARLREWTARWFAYLL